MFRESVFESFLDLKPIALHLQLIHNLLLREVKQPNCHELWINHNEIFLRFGIGEYSLITGLSVSNSSLKSSFATGNLGFKNVFFPNTTTVNRQIVRQVFCMR